MEHWLCTLLCSLFVVFFLNSLSALFFSGKPNKRLPPGPFTVPLIENIPWLRRSFNLEPILRDLKAKYGPIITHRPGARPEIFIANHSLAHQALVQNGAVFSDRPRSVPVIRLLSSNQRNISSAAYGPTWRLLRRNLTSEILHPSRIKSYSNARQWVLGVLVRKLQNDSSESGVKVIDHFQYAMFCLLVLMCFGEKLEEQQIRQIEESLRKIVLCYSRFNILNSWPTIGKVLFWNRWKELKELARDRENTLTPFIKARIEAKERAIGERKNEDDSALFGLAYVDTPIKLELPEEKRKLSYGEMATLCGEFLNAGTDTTSTALQWIMANLVKHPSIQAKLYEEILGVIETPEEEGVKEEDLQRMPYLKAVVLEGLRRHPPVHFLQPHLVTEEVELEGYVIPKNSVINFAVAELGRDPTVWEDPMEFKPERFLSGEALDLSGNREIKMMPFGAGRRICPGLALSVLHLEYFVANLVWFLEWKGVEGDDVDLAEKLVFSTVMKHPLRAHLYPRK
ncbi:cytochrome P450 89A2-like [Ipomoea triloba]|uniref:cytochrome P450 89A2-like n=1 Tax=Ipomoea triloba TaxID=35885 RepID=UPI00125D4AEE|nr:cytochrome P450 89A2-like [Ipomoea triloba]XP_031109729.1 cytochrome P450 89A2-like [Ipomoea triloba]